MKKADPLAKPFGMSEAEYELRLRASKSAHRIYEDMLNLLLFEVGRLAPDERDLALGAATVMVAEHLGRILGGPDVLNREVRDARTMLQRLRTKQ